MPDLTVVIVSWNTRALLAACLRSLLVDLEQAGLQADIHVVDNNSDDGTPEMVTGSFPQVRVVAQSENVGFARANNRILKEMVPPAAETGYVWLLNPDTEVLPGATAALIAALDARPAAGIVGPALVYADGTFQHAAFRFPGIGQLAFDLFPLPRRLYDSRLNGRYPARLYEKRAPFPVDHPLGASMMVRTAVLSHVGLLDEGFWMYCEEIDWCWRMHKDGWQAYCAPAAHIVHHAGQSSGQARLSSFVNLWTSRARLYARHHGLPTRQLARGLVRVGMRRRMRGAPPELRAACQEILHAWEQST